MSFETDQWPTDQAINRSTKGAEHAEAAAGC